MKREREVLWTPTKERYAASTMATFEHYLHNKLNLTFSNYNEMWKWSISELELFWDAISQFFDMRFFEPPQMVLGKKDMPGAEWFPGAKVNYADQVLSRSGRLSEQIAFVSISETFERKELSWHELRQKVAAVADAFKKMGVTKGDRVVSILPNTEVALIAFLATSSLGAIWSICSLDMGHVAILDRFKQIKPKLLIAQNGYIHAGKAIDRSEVLKKINNGLETLDKIITVSVITNGFEGDFLWLDLLNNKAPFNPTPVAFDHPLWIVYSSGTTGNPKPIVHGHGGILLETMKQSLHHDLTEKDHFSWLTSSGWIMWNAQWTALAQGARVVAFDGAPNYPDMGRVWEFIAEERLTYFGAGAAFFEGCIKAGINPKARYDFFTLRSMGSTGSPLSGDAFHWIYQKVKKDLWLAPISGGTDLSGAFVLGHPGMSVRKGEMQCRALGNAVHAFDEEGNNLIDQVGELVCTQPLPSMPLYLWGDKDGSRLHESYFDTYPGVWRHGDWIKINKDGGSVIFGRSDATINRKGLRMGSAEIYQAVEGLSEIRDSLVVDLEFLGREGFMPLFVVLMPEAELDEALCHRIHEVIKSQISPRFLPDAIIEIVEVPRTLSGKKLEIPVKKLLLGGTPEEVVNRDSMLNPQSFDFFVEYNVRKKRKNTYE